MGWSWLNIPTVVAAWIGGFWAFMQLLQFLFFHRPRLRGDIEEVLSTAEMPNPITRKPYPTLLLRIHVANHRQQPTTIKHWRLKVIRRGSAAIDGQQLKPDNLSELSPPTDLAEATWGTALDYGRGFRGWLRFAIPDMLTAELQPGVRLVVTAIDSLGGKHKIARWLPANEIRSARSAMPATQL